MVKKYSETEKKILSKFDQGTTFLLNGVKHIVEFSGKPQPNGGGECKTDVFIKTNTQQNENNEFKISVKQKNADFLENKITLDRAIEIFGPSASKLISNSTKKIEFLFKDQELIKNSPSSGTLIMMGWKFELFNKSTRKLSGEIILKPNQRQDALKEIYKGQRLDKKKKDALVKGNRIKDSGVAEYILFVDQESTKTISPQQYINEIQKIDSFIEGEKIFFGCTALNYRAKKDKWDGNRPLCVWVNWHIKNSLLVPELIFNNPLEFRGNKIGETIRIVLKRLQLNKSGFNDIMKYYKNCEEK